MTAIENWIQLIYDALNNKENVVGLFFDLSQAFDTVDHRLLLDKLYAIGVRGKAYSWAETYLDGRKQVVVIDGVVSDTGLNEAGVPQGSILGPLLFLIFVNDVETLCNTPDLTVMYADDTSMLIKNKCLDTLASKCNMATEEFQSYCSSNGLKLNAKKTYFIQFLPKNIVPSYDLLVRVEGKTMASTETFKLLGLYVDRKLTWEAHIEKLCEKLSASCYILRNLRGTVSVGVLRVLYHGVAQSHLQYGLLFWGSSSHINKAFKYQKKILRCMDNATSRVSCRPLFRKFRILTLPCMYILQLIIYIKNNYEKYTRNSDIHNFNTRTSSNLHLPFSRLRVSQGSPVYMGIKCFNKISSLMGTLGLRILPRNFLSQVKLFLMENPFYSMEEFLDFRKK